MNYKHDSTRKEHDDKAQVDKSSSEYRPAVNAGETDEDLHDVRILLIDNLDADLYSSLKCALNTGASKKSISDKATAATMAYSSMRLLGN
jgi:hypothetical protein